MSGTPPKIQGRRPWGPAPAVVSLFLAWLLGAASPALCAVESDLSRPNGEDGPTRVQVNLYLADLYEISGAEQSFLADVVLQAEWQDARLAGRWAGPQGVDLDAVWNPSLQIVNQRGVSASLPRRVEVDPSGRVLYRQRWWGRFSARLDLKDFPLDRQRFHVQVVSLGYPRGEVELVPFPENKRVGRAEQLSVTDWEVGPARVETADFEPAPGTRALAGVRLAWEARRYVGYYAVQVILPLVMIVLMGWTALWVEPSVVTTRMSVSVTTMLTLIAYRFALGRLVPNLTYLTRFDYFTLGSTALVFLMLLVVLTCAYLMGKGQKAFVQRIDGWARLIFPVAFSILFLLIWWL